ncbi:hypothetical protein EJB05_26581, partial [Eragrostis curvula]
MPPPQSAPADGGSGISSTVCARTETGWHVLKVEGYSLIKKVIGIGNHIKSGTFNVGGHSWCIRCFPDGHNNESADWICVDVYLNNPPPAGDIKVRFKLSLLDQAGEPVPAYTKMGSTSSFSSTATSWGFFHFIERKVLESSYLKGNSFKIRCDVTAIMEICTETKREESLCVPPSDIHCHLGAILANNVRVDVTVEVGGEVFMAHRIVLAARSPVFMAELFGPMKENVSTHVQIDDMEAKVFKVFLHFIYNDSLPEIEEGDKMIMAQHLLVAADKYNMERLKLICEGILRNYIDSSLVATTLVLAEQHGCHGLKAACFNFLKSPGNLTAAMASDGFQHLKSSCPSLLEELLAKLKYGVLMQ